MPLSGLPCSFGEEPRQFLGVLADFVRRGVAQAAAFGVRHFRPFEERFVGGGDRVVEVGRARLRRQPDDFAGRRIADFEMIARGDFSAVDDKIKLLTAFKLSQNLSTRCRSVAF